MLPALRDRSGMPMNLVRLFAIATMLTAWSFAATAQAPAPPEDVTVTATKLRDMLDTFVKSSVAPTKLTGKIARWEKGICPLVVGQSPVVATMVTQQVKAVATAVGAPVDASPSCTPNIEIVFSTTPQALVDNIKKDDPDYLGYATTSAQREALATISRPVQAWYETETVDLDGMRRVDSARRLEGITMSNFTAFSMPSTGRGHHDPIDLPDATYARVTGNHINGGAHSAFHHVIVVIDSNKLAGQKLGPVADYIAMLALTQLNSPDACQQLPSITNNFASGCERKADSITTVDAAYLRGLYKMDADKSLIYQQNDIAALMMKDTQGR